jgi:hypothetical protein
LTKPVLKLPDSVKKRITPTLTIKGFVIHCTNALTIVSAVTFFSALGGGAVAGINSIHTVQAAAVAALSQFFVFLALKRGLIQNKETKTNE